MTVAVRIDVSSVVSGVAIIDEKVPVWDGQVDSDWLGLPELL